MFEYKTFLISVVRSTLGFLPIILAPVYIANSKILIDFYRLLIIFSLLTSFVVLGLQNYIFSINSGYLKYENRKIIWALTGIIKIFSIIIFLFIIIFGIFSDNFLRYFNYALLVPFGFQVFNQYVYLARKNYKLFLISFLQPIMVFISIIIASHLFGGIDFYLLTAVILIISNLYILNIEKLLSIFNLKIFIIKKLIAYFKLLRSLIFNGVCLSIVNPLISLELISLASNSNAPIYEVSSYFIYYRIFDGLVGFVVGYFIIYRIDKSSNDSIFKYISTTFILFYFVIFTAIFNYIIYISTGFYSLTFYFLEFIIAILKVLFALLAYRSLVRLPFLNSSREVIFLLFLLGVGLVFPPNGIISLQICVLFVFLITYLISLALANKGANYWSN